MGGAGDRGQKLSPSPLSPTSPIMHRMVRHFRELRVYQDAFGAAMTIFRLSRSWPQEERYSVTDQIRRASRSASANIAEAWRKRRYPAHFTSKLSDADSETAETQAWLDYAHS